MSFRVKKKWYDKDKKCSVPINGAYAFTVQWEEDDIRKVPRKIRGTILDRRCQDTFYK